MPTVLLTYDISEKHAEVKQEMASKGWADKWQGSKGTIIPMPTSTLYKTNASRKDAVAELENACDLHGAKLERAVAVEYIGGYGIPGKPQE